MSEFTIIETNDGSHSVFSKEYEASYHSTFGAIEESITVFISAGLIWQVKNKLTKIRIFEMGFGTGLNALLTAIEANRLDLRIEYYGIEKHPIPLHTMESINYGSMLNQESLYNQILQSPWGKSIQLNDHFILHKIHGDIDSYVHSKQYDIIYYDAFAPRTQAHLWQEGVHAPLFKQLNKKSCLVTYCAQGAFKRMLKDIGYTIQSLPGPSHKKEIIRATK